MAQYFIGLDPAYMGAVINSELDRNHSGSTIRERRALRPYFVFHLKAPSITADCLKTAEKMSTVSRNFSNMAAFFPGAA